MPAGSLPWFGSVNPKQPINSPVAEVHTYILIIMTARLMSQKITKGKLYYMSGYLHLSKQRLYWTLITNAFSLNYGKIYQDAE